MPKQTKDSRSITLIVQLVTAAVVVLLAAGLAYQHKQIVDLKNDTSQIGSIYNTIDSNAQASAVVVSPQDSRVYIPELRISLPYNDITKTLRYTYGARDGVRFYSTLVTDHAVHRISCYDMVRAKYEPTPNAYSPGQPLVASVAVGGATLQLYAETNGECAAQAWFQITPTQIANELKQAQAY